MNCIVPATEGVEVKREIINECICVGEWDDSVQFLIFVTNSLNFLIKLNTRGGHALLLFSRYRY